MNEYGLCPKCGGVKSLGRPEQTERVRTSVFKACTCKSESEKKHDSRLDEHGTYTVVHENGMVQIEKDDWSNAPNYVLLTPKQALSLLAWLTQEKSELERRAKG